jgi:hypothetical protein
MKLKIIYSSILIVSLLLTTTFASVIGNISVKIDDKISTKIDESIVTADIPKFKNKCIITEKDWNDVKEDDLSRFKKGLNLIKLIFRDNKGIVNICQQANILLQILPDSICHIIYWFVVSPLSLILLSIWNNHPDYLIQYYAYSLYELLIEIYSYFCDWVPTIHLNVRSIDVVSNKNICPCVLTR